MDKLEDLYPSQWSRLVESLIERKIRILLQDRHIDISEIYTRAESERNDMEIDILAANETDVVAVEVKTTLKPDKVEEFIDKLKKFKQSFRHFADSNVYGAVAFLRDESSAGKYAQEKGLFAIKATGDRARIINHENFKPKLW